MLAVDDIHVHYGRIAAVRGVSLRVEEGEIVCVVGPNGAGKSTTLLSIAGALKPTKGTIRLGDRRISGLATDAVVRLGISLVPEGRRIFGALTVDENLRLATHVRKDRAETKTDYRMVLEHFPVLHERKRLRAGKLSGGEQQQLAIARAILTKPRIMLVDEPALGLAPQVISDVYHILKQLRDDGTTLLIVEQSTDRALAVADRIYVMRNGLIALSGSSQEFRADDRVRQAYFGFAEQPGAKRPPG